MDARIGYYEDDRRVLPTLTLAGRPVTLPVMTTISLGNGYFAVLDTFPPQHFDVEVEANKLRAAVGGTIQPLVGERTSEDPRIIDVGEPFQSAPPPDVYGSFSQDVPGSSDVSGTKGRK